MKYSLKTLTLLVFFCTFASFAGQQNSLDQQNKLPLRTRAMVFGRIARNNLNNLFFLPENHSASFRIVNTNDEVSQVLARLETDDQIYGVGNLDIEHANVRFESIERIGLHKLLGAWSSKAGEIEVTSYSKIIAHPNPNENIPLENCPGANKNKIDFQYSVVPGSGKLWVLFLSACGNNFYTTLDLNDKKLVVQVYNSSGALLRTLSFSKNPLN